MKSGWWILPGMVLGALIWGVVLGADVTYQKGKDKDFIGGCTDAIEREDGTPLTPEEIARVEYYIDDTDGNLTNPLHTVLMQGGCTDSVIDLGLFPTDITFYAYAITIDTDGLTSVPSTSKSFLIKKANPNAPGQLR